MTPPPQHRLILGSRIDATDYADATRRILDQARAGKSGYVIAANVHVVMEAHDSPAFARVINGADLVTPDGMPLVWALRLLGVRGQPRVYGPDLMLHVCAQATAAGLPIGLYGGTADSLAALQANLRARWPALQIVYASAPPFRPLTADEDAAVVSAIESSGARLLFVGLGCPKQECWAAEHQRRVPAVMLAVGAAFDFHAGRVRQAPRWVQRAGLEWLFRLAQEPRRLLCRYLKHNPRFVILFLRQWLGPRRA